MVRSSQGQLSHPAFAVNYQMSMTLAALTGRRAEMTAALG
jgi:hypothetical protein